MSMTEPAMEIVVRVLPVAVDIVVLDGESIMEAAQRQGFYWPTRCRGQALCTACLFEVVGDPDAFSAIAPREEDVLDSFTSLQARRTGQLRLGCQARLTRSATVFKRGVKVADPPPRPTGFLF
jgi:ferredoxin